MNSDKQDSRFRDQEEQSTQQRAAILGIGYFDTRGMADTAELVKDMVPLEDMYKNKFI